MRANNLRTGAGFLFVAILAFTSLTFEDLVWAKEAKKLSKRSRAALDAQKVLVEKELSALALHPWAGQYYYGDGLGVNVALSLAPKSGFAFTWNGCLGLYDLNYGDVVEVDGRIRLKPKFPNERDGFNGLASELIPIAWGERHYLISPNAVLEFANDINAGFEPRENIGGVFLLKKGDEHKAVKGKPSLPSPFSEYLLSRSIQAEISSIKESRIEKDERITRLTLNVGGDQGVKEGMKFYVYSPSTVFEWARITRVSDTASEGEVTQRLADEKFGRLSGDWRFSTSAKHRCLDSSQDRACPGSPD